MKKKDLLAYQAAGPEEKREIAQRLVIKDEPLILQMVKKYAHFAPAAVEWEELLQAGRIAFLKALEGTNLKKGSFSTYFGFWIRNEIRRVTERTELIYMPSRATMDHRSIKLEQKIQSAHGRLATAKELGVTEERLKIWREQPMRVTGGTHEAVSQEESPEQKMIDDEERANARARILTLSEKDQKMLTMLRDGVTIGKVAWAVGTTPKKIKERLAQIAAKQRAASKD